MFSWRAALRFGTAGRAGCCAKEPQQTLIRGAGEGSPVETDASWGLCCNGVWSAVPQEPAWLWTPSSTVCACAWTHSSGVPTLWDRSVKPRWASSEPVWVCLRCVPVIGSAEEPSAAGSAQGPDAAWCWAGGTDPAWAQSLHALLHSAQRWAQQQPCIRAGFVPCPTKAQTEFSLGLIALTPSQSLSNPSGLCYLALLGAQHRDNWESSTRCIHILCYMKVLVWMWILLWSGLQP